MHKKKHKEIILEILAKSERILRSDLKDMVMHKMRIDSYPKQSFAYHIDRLVEEGKIQRIETDSNNEYIALHKTKLPVHGELLLLNMEGRIHVPELLAGFDISITDVFPTALKNEYINLFFQFNAKNLCLKIPKQATPFKIHLSRKKYHKAIHPDVLKDFGARTITLELPILHISSYSLDTQNNDKKGQIIISFKESHCEITDLKTTNQSKFAFVNELNYEKFINEVSLFSDLTLDSNLEKRLPKIVSTKTITYGTNESFSLPAIIILGPDSQAGIF